MASDQPIYRQADVMSALVVFSFLAGLVAIFVGAPTILLVVPIICFEVFAWRILLQGIGGPIRTLIDIYPRPAFAYIFGHGAYYFGFAWALLVVGEIYPASIVADWWWNDPALVAVLAMALSYFLVRRPRIRVRLITGHGLRASVVLLIPLFVFASLSATAVGVYLLVYLLTQMALLDAPSGMPDGNFPAWPLWVGLGCVALTSFLIDVLYRSSLKGEGDGKDSSLISILRKGLVASLSSTVLSTLPALLVSFHFYALALSGWPPIAAWSLLAVLDVVLPALWVLFNRPIEYDPWGIVRFPGMIGMIYWLLAGFFFLASLTLADKSDWSVWQLQVLLGLGGINFAVVFVWICLVGWRGWQNELDLAQEDLERLSRD